MTRASATISHRSAIAIIAGCVVSMASAAFAADPASVAAGQTAAFDRAKGNCLACHTMKGGDVPSNVGPELNDMKTRFPKRADLYAIIYDEETRNPLTVMPAFGKNFILNDKEINEIVDFLQTL